MKSFLVSLAIGLCSLVCYAPPLVIFPPADAYTVGYSITNLSGISTNPITNTNLMYESLYHTIQINCQSNLNGAVVETDFSLDSTNWVPYNTNTFAALALTGTPLQNQYLFTGKEYFWRSKITGTNFTGQIVYMGGR